MNVSPLKAHTRVIAGNRVDSHAVDAERMYSNTSRFSFDVWVVVAAILGPCWRTGCLGIWPQADSTLSSMVMTTRRRGQSRTCIHGTT
jgi:hypothetical protein